MDKIKLFGSGEKENAGAVLGRKLVQGLVYYWAKDKAAVPAVPFITKHALYAETKRLKRASEKIAYNVFVALYDAINDMQLDTGSLQAMAVLAITEHTACLGRVSTEEAFLLNRNMLPAIVTRTEYTRLRKKAKQTAGDGADAATVQETIMNLLKSRAEAEGRTFYGTGLAIMDDETAEHFGAASATKEYIDKTVWNTAPLEGQRRLGILSLMDMEKPDISGAAQEAADLYRRINAIFATYDIIGRVFDIPGIGAIKNTSLPERIDRAVASYNHIIQVTYNAIAENDTADKKRALLAEYYPDIDLGNTDIAQKPIAEAENVLLSGYASLGSKRLYRDTIVGALANASKTNPELD